jgi:hypothetical protein
MTLNAGFHELGMAPEVTYRLAFKPENVTADGSFHAVKVKLAGTSSHLVTALPGYFAPSKQAPDVLRAKLEREVALTDSITEFPMDVALQQAAQNTLLVNTHVDIARLRFLKQNDRQMQTITFVTALLDSQGKIVAAKEGTMSLALRDATYTRLAQSGIKAALRLQVPPGSYTLREVVEEENEGKMACLSRAVEVR